MHITSRDKSSSGGFPMPTEPVLEKKAGKYDLKKIVNNTLKVEKQFNEINGFNFE